MKPLLEIRNANLSFPTRRGLFGRGTAVPVLRDVSLRLETGQVLGIVGESGSGKSTLARLVLRLLKADSGAVLIDGQDHRDLSPRAFAAAVQPVFQDPYSSLNPKRTLAQILEMPLVLAGDFVAEERRTRVCAMLDRVGLPQRLLHGHAAHFVEPGILRRLLQLGQERGGLVVADPLLLLEPRIGAQPQHVVVGKASAAERLGKNHFLLRGRVEPESVGALGFHSHSIIDLCKDSKPNGGCERKGHASRAALSLPGMNAGVSRAER